MNSAHGREPTNLEPYTPRSEERTGPDYSDIEPASQLLNRELLKIERRIQEVTADGREQFYEGSVSYDRASMAAIRLAALFEDGTTFAPFLSAATPSDRKGVNRTRNIASHSGYRGMNDTIFWESVTVDMVKLITKIRAANQPDDDV